MNTRYDQGCRKIGPGRCAYWQAWLPQDQVRAVVVIVHGVHEHSGRYAQVGNRLAGRGYAAYAADHRGHGRSDGRRANIERMTLIAADLSSFARFAAGRHPDLPVFMVGHSLGGLIALHYAINSTAIASTAIASTQGSAGVGVSRPMIALDGLVVSGPAVEAVVGSALQRRLAGVLSALVPNLGVAAIDTDQKTCRDPEVVRAYREDPLMYCSTMVHDMASSPDKTVRRYQGLYHEVFNEPERETILADLISWLDQHLPARNPATHPAG